MNRLRGRLAAPRRLLRLSLFFILTTTHAYADLSCQQLLEAGFIENCPDLPAGSSEPSDREQHHLTSSEDTAPIQAACKCDSGIETCTHSLVGFKTNSFIHPAEEAFCRQIANKLDSADNANIIELKIEGTSDGQAAPQDIYGWPKVVLYQDGCARRKTGRFSEIELAEIRGCIVQQRIEDFLGVPIEALLRDGQFGSAPHNYPNMKIYIGSAFRKVDVKYKLIRSCND